MATSKALVPTAHASRYLQQLCKHWSHKFDVTFDAMHGHVPLPLGAAALEAGETMLTVTVTSAEEGNVARLQQVVADHLNRFAFREGALVFDWTDI